MTGYHKLDINKDETKNIQDIFNKTSKNDEYEVMFYNYKKNNMLSFERFQNVLNYMNARSKIKKLKLLNINVLDVIYQKDLVSYRIQINDIDTINEYLTMTHKRKNHVIYKVLLTKIDNDDNISIMKKTKNMKLIQDVNDYNFRVRLSKEEDVTKDELKTLKSLTNKDGDSIVFRYKQRLTLTVDNSASHSINIDATTTKMHKSINNIHSAVPVHEIEIDYTSSKSSNAHLEKIFIEVSTLLKIFQQSNFIISDTETKLVLDKYNIVLGIDKKMTNLDGRRSQSLEVQHVVDKLPNRYAVTDKADGERYFLVIFDLKVYLISYNLEVKYTGHKLADKLSKYNNTILDGEYIYIESENRHIFMAFDCLYTGTMDVRKLSSFTDRLKYADEVIEKCFIAANHTDYKMKQYNGDFTINKIIDFHKKEMGEYLSALVKNIKIDKKMLLVRRKYFISVTGGKPNEIFKYARLLWNEYIYNKSNNCPYMLDGMMFHPLEQRYTTKDHDTKYVEYKWKPPEKNSIDFYVQFERSRDTGKIITVYDNSNEDYARSKPYRICNLYVGKRQSGAEKPVLFQEDNRKYMAHLFVEDGEARDQIGNIINDGTVVEFYYNMDASIPDVYRWVALRTRHDKTESVIRFGKKYGNYETVANKVWRSIINPFVYDDIIILANDGQYEKHNNTLRNKIDHSLILSEKKENIYYQIRTNLAKPMRQFHNYIKSILIYTHCDHTYESKKLTVLDIACGRGGDIMKFYHATVEYSVGIDVDNEGLTSPIDGATSRYYQLKKSYPNFPRMFFIHADASALLNYNNQNKVLGGMTPKNKTLINKFFEQTDRKLFDRVNCQFALHYFLEDDTTWSNFCENIDNNLKPGGYALFTCFDARKVISLLNNKNNMTIHYTNQKGEKRVLFDIVKKFDDSVLKQEMIGVGHAIDVHNAIDFQEGVYKTEFLVDMQFLLFEFKKRCNMTLVDTDTFDNQFYIHKDYFGHIIKYEENPKTQQFLMKTAEFYNQEDNVNKASFQLSSLNRYYIFRKDQ
jgi:hypothetical protein